MQQVVVSHTTGSAVVAAPAVILSVGPASASETTTRLLDQLDTVFNLQVPELPTVGESCRVPHLARTVGEGVDLLADRAWTEL